MDFEILHVLAFDSTRKRMSVIVRHPLTKEIVLYTKGADSAILSVLAKKYKGKKFLFHEPYQLVIYFLWAGTLAVQWDMHSSPLADHL